MALPSAQKVKTELHTFLLEGNKDITRSSWKQVYSACLGRVVGSQTSYRRNICGGKQITRGVPSDLFCNVLLLQWIVSTPESKNLGDLAAGELCQWT